MRRKERDGWRQKWRRDDIRKPERQVCFKTDVRDREVEKSQTFRREERHTVMCEQSFINTRKKHWTTLRERSGEVLPPPCPRF